MLVPKDHVLDSVRSDYRAMENMIFGMMPDFEEILEVLQTLQEEINLIVRIHWQKERVQETVNPTDRAKDRMMGISNSLYAFRVSGRIPSHFPPPIFPK